MLPAIIFGVNDHPIAAPLREAEALIALAFARLGKLGPGGVGTPVGSWVEYRALGQLMLKTRALADRIEAKELRARRTVSPAIEAWSAYQEKRGIK